MGSGIAASLVRAGIPTAIMDVSAAMLEAAVKTVRKVAGEGPGERPERLVTATSPAILADCDVVIEAVTEDEAIKTATYRSVAGILREGTVLASNTSTIPISRMARSTAHPDRFAGMHFFHPAHRMELVEVIRGEQTSDDTVATLVALAGKLGKTPIVVHDCPGFLVTRVLFPYLSQALQLLQEGVAMDAIDEAAVGFGMPMGPIALLDFIGLDTALAIANVMAEGYPDRAAPSPLLAEMVGSGRLGRKSARASGATTRRGRGRYRTRPSHRSWNATGSFATRSEAMTSWTASSCRCSSNRSGCSKRVSSVTRRTSISGSSSASASRPPGAGSFAGATPRGPPRSWNDRSDWRASAPGTSPPTCSAGWHSRRRASTRRNRRPLSPANAGSRPRERPSPSSPGTS